jgi:hypothetical protein
MTATNLRGITAMTNPFLVGVTGYATSGKDTFAQGLIDQLGFVKIAFAGPLRRDIAVLNPIVSVEGWMGEYTIRASDCFENYNESKEKYPEFRRLLQVYGTEVHRSLDDNYWIDRSMVEVGDAPGYVFTDMRFPNERNEVPYDFTVRVEREGVGPLNDHASEAFIGKMEVDMVVANDGTASDLARSALSLVSARMAV